MSLNKYFHDIYLEKKKKKKTSPLYILQLASTILLQQ